MNSHDLQSLGANLAEFVTLAGQSRDCSSKDHGGEKRRGLMRSKLTTSQNVQRCAADQPGNGRQHRPGQQCSQLVVAEPVISNANSKNRRSHNTAERINCISKVLHVLEPPKTQPLYNIRQLKVRIA